MSADDSDEPTTIDLHSEAPIDFTASAPDEVREELRRSGVVLAKRQAIGFALVALLFFGLTGLEAWRVRGLSPPATDATLYVVVGAIVEALALGSLATFFFRRWRKLKSEALRR
jgi:hypothetical protein